MKTLLIGVGSILRTDDGAGPKLIELVEDKPIEGIVPIDGGTVPENTTHIVRAEEPDQIIIVDAAEMGLKVGKIRLINEDDIAKSLFITTHTMPLNFLIDAYKKICENIYFIGIQPRSLEFCDEMSPEVSQAVEKVYDLIKTNTFADLDYV